MAASLKSGSFRGSGSPHPTDIKNKPTNGWRDILRFEKNNNKR
jgi:hypothetical protein